MAAYVSTILSLALIFLCIMCEANKASLQIQGETLHYGTISKQAIFVSPTESSSRDHMSGGPMRTLSMRTEPYA